MVETPPSNDEVPLPTQLQRIRKQLAAIESTLYSNAYYQRHRTPEDPDDWCDCCDPPCYDGPPEEDGPPGRTLDQRMTRLETEMASLTDRVMADVQILEELRLDVRLHAIDYRISHQIARTHDLDHKNSVLHDRVTRLETEKPTTWKPLFRPQRKSEQH